MLLFGCALEQHDGNRGGDGDGYNRQENTYRMCLSERSRKMASSVHAPETFKTEGQRTRPPRHPPGASIVFNWPFLNGHRSVWPRNYRHGTAEALIGRLTT